MREKESARKRSQQKPRIVVKYRWDESKQYQYQYE